MTTKTSTTPAPEATTTPSSPRSSPADGPGVPEEENYALEAAAFAESANDAYDLDFDVEDVSQSSGGVEPPAEGGGETTAAPVVGSPATTPPDSGAQAPVVQPEAAQQAAQAETQGQPQPVVPAAQQPAATPQPAAQQTAAPQPAQAATSNPAEGDLLAQVRANLDAGRETYAKALAEQVYQMTEDQANEVLVEPQKVLPQLAARVHLEVAQNVLGTLAQVLPGVVLGVQSAQRQQAQLEDQFFQAWPTLDKASDYNEVMSLARVFRSQYPNAPVEEMIKQVGAMAVVKLGKLPAATAPAQVPQAPAQQAYRPAVGVPSAVQPAARDDNPWAGISELLIE